ncbi:MAG: HAD family hydrolase [Deltaproteobacteria bacterium]|nr:HAD family hydrolase [Deltaproteobacteria bacterium]MBW2053219.1 HAD family hydrolase [Deltaproteobacteria bacterium]MBW2140124.1 HAD family hydrolase [Deltaproteobacteria bacterium]MBW2323505.1 HAD family hydrolase [Deltaproteobacteria bacterium]
MKHDSLIFDLDGTLWDTTEQCAKAWNIGLARLGISSREITTADIAAVTGLPYDKCVSVTFPEASPEDLSKLVDYLNIAEEEIILAEGGRLFDGVAKGLRKLGRRFPLFIVSNCQSWYLDFFLSWSGLKPLFKDKESYGNTGMSKAENIALIKKRNQLLTPVYIGDTTNDYNAAMEAKIDFIHLKYGFGDPVDGILSLDNFDELVDSLLS